MKNLYRNFVVFFALLCFNFAYSWGTTGHRIIAEIAENHLTAKSKRQLKKMIGEQKLAYWANWADFLKSDTTGVWKSADPWHYVNISPQTNVGDFTTALRAQKAPNLYTQIQVLSGQVKNKDTPPKDREIALRFLVHLMGDAAQPMHLGRAEDLGGNRIKVKFFGENTNLHALWDSKIVDFQQYSYTEYARVLDVKPRSEVLQIQAGTLEDWLFESHQAANRIYADAKDGDSYFYNYNYKYQALLEKQLLYGGLRLAKMLNEIL